MVANQGFLTKPKDQMVKLQKSKNGKYFVNTKDWDKALRIVFETHNLSIFLSPPFGIKVPKEQLSRALFEGEMRFALESSKAHNLNKKRAVVKSEKIEESDAIEEEAGDGTVTPQKPSRSASSLSGAQRAELSRLNERQRAFEEVVKRNAAEIAETQKKEAAKDFECSEVAIFVDPMTCVRPDERELNEKATIEVVVDGVRKFYECETNEARKRRISAWHLLIWTIPDVEKAVYDMMSVGDVHSLYKVISKHLSKTNKAEHVKASLKRELEKFKHRGGELFKTFVARYRQLRREMDQVGYIVDEDILHQHIRKVIMEAGGAPEKAYLAALPNLADGEKDACVILDAMSAQMNVLEKHDHLRGADDDDDAEGEHSDSESDEEKRKERKRERNRKQREKKKKKKKERLEEEARVLRAQGSQDYSHVRGVCLFHQEGNCSRGDQCAYKHIKLSKADHEKLKAFMKQRPRTSNNSSTSSYSERTCFGCGQKGHIATYCPNKAGAPAAQVMHAQTKQQQQQAQGQAQAMMADMVKAFASHMGGKSSAVQALLNLDLQGEGEKGE